MTRTGNHVLQNYSCCQTVNGIFDGRIIGKRDGNGKFISLKLNRDPRTVWLFINPGYPHIRSFAPSPGEGLQRPVSGIRCKDLPDQFLIRAVDHCSSMTEECKLFLHLLFQSLKMLIVGMSDIGEDADGRADDRLQAFHLTGP